MGRLSRDGMHFQKRLSEAGRSARRSAAMVVGLTLAMTLGALMTASGPGSAIDRHLALYVTTLGGWADRPGGEDGGAGPALAVVSGDRVTIDLTSEDGLEHGLFIDYNANGVPDNGDFMSNTTTSTITFSFVPDVVGLFNYCDRLVPLNCGKWSTQRPNRPPTGTFVAPALGASWTSGAPHDIVFNVSDPDGDPLNVTLSYSYNGGTVRGSIAGPFRAGANPNTYSWTPPGFHGSDTILHLFVQDPGGLNASVDTPAFEVDATHPTIVATTPARGAASVDRGAAIVVTWSESMNPTSAEPTSFGVRVRGGPWIAGTVAWSANVTAMTFSPTSLLNALTTYEVHVNATAKDSSDPGNAFAGPDIWTFSTGSAGDTNRPTILGVHANPPSQFANAPVNVTADVQDDVGVSRVDAAVTGPSGNENLTMTHATGTEWYVNRTFPAAGHYDVVVWASDFAGNLVSQGLGFDISSAGNPNVPAPVSVTAKSADGVVEVTWTSVNFAGMAGYNVYRGEAANGPFVRLTSAPLKPTAPTVFHDGPPAGRTYFYTVTAVNAAGEESPFGPRASVTIPPYQPSPLFDPVPWAIAGLTLGLILGVLYGTIWRRKLA